MRKLLKNKGWKQSHTNANQKKVTSAMLSAKVGSKAKGLV
jgi:hypothetical protein